MIRDDWYEWRYLLNGKVAHALEPGHVRSGSTAKCGIFPFLSDWLGTGNQNEYERAAELPRCISCLRKIGGVW